LRYTLASTAGCQAGSLSATYTADTSVRIGNSTAFEEPTYGVLDDVRIYNRVLSATEVSTPPAASAPPFAMSLLDPRTF
jgi:Concanavalin A-like lectin/glucanases superfamily